MARDPQNLHGPALLSQCPQDAPQHPSLPSSLSPSFALIRDSLLVTRPKPPVSSCRASYHAASVAATVSSSKELYLAAAVATAGFLCFPPPYQPLPPSDTRTHLRQRYTLIISTAFGYPVKNRGRFEVGRD